MSKFFSALSSTILLATSHQCYAQAISKDYQKACVREQVSEHQGLKGKAPTEDDFTAYCICQAEFVNKNATNSQINELVMDPKAKPQWLKTLESKAIKSCLTTDVKMST